MSEKTTIDVIIVEPRKPPKVIALEDSLEAMQKAVGGGIMTLSVLPESAGEEKMSMVQILTALMLLVLLVAETYAAGMLIL